ncbi:MAG: hypothetical protein AB1540_11065 [Bdellovibrionota bacterium]
MDLRHDWKALNEVLFEQQGLSATGSRSSMVLLEENNRIVDGVVSNGRPFRDVGAEGLSLHKQELDALALKYSVEQAVVLSKKSFDQYVFEAAAHGTNFFQQLQTLRSKVLSDVGRKKDGELIVSRRHFILDLFGKHLRRVLPRRFNVLLFVDQRPHHSIGPQASAPLSYRAILLTYSDGQLDQFFEPDFSSLHENRLINWPQEYKAIGQYLETRYILPCYAILMNEEDWNHCLEAASTPENKPWKLFVRYYDEGKAAVFPNHWLTKALLATQRLMVYFGRL